MDSEEDNHALLNSSEYESSPNQNVPIETPKATSTGRHPYLIKKKNINASFLQEDHKCDSESSSRGPTQDNSSNSSYSTVVDPSPLDMKHLQDLHVSLLKAKGNGIPLDSILCSFDSPNVERPLCSSRINSPNDKIRSKSLEFPDCSPIIKGLKEMAGTFCTTPKHSNNLTENTLRKRSYSFSGHEEWIEKTVSPDMRNVRSSPSSLSSSSPANNIDFMAAPANTPDVNSAASHSTNNSSRHSSGESQHRIGKAGINRKSAHFSKKECIRPDDDIPWIQHSSKKVVTWLHQIPSSSGSRSPSLFREAAEQSSKKQSTSRKVPTQADLTNFNVSDFSFDGRYGPLEESGNQSRSPHQLCNRTSGEYFLADQTDRHYEIRGYSGQLRSYPEEVNSAWTPGNYPQYSEGVPVHGHIPYFPPYPAPIPSYPPMFFQNYETMHPLAMSPFYYCPHPIEGFPCQPKGQEEVTPQGDGPRTTKPKPQKSSANRICRLRKMFIRKHRHMSRLLKKRSKNQNVSNSSIKVETLAVI